jgi:hypothetical protein
MKHTPRYDLQQDDVPTIQRTLRKSAVEQGGEEDLCVDESNLREDGT